MTKDQLFIKEKHMAGYSELGETLHPFMLHPVGLCSELPAQSIHIHSQTHAAKPNGPTGTVWLGMNGEALTHGMSHSHKQTLNLKLTHAPKWITIKCRYHLLMLIFN